MEPRPAEERQREGEPEEEWLLPSSDLLDPALEVSDPILTRDMSMDISLSDEESVIS